MYFSFEVGVVILELFKWLWLIADPVAGWPDWEVHEMRQQYNKFDIDGNEELKNRDILDLLDAIGLHLSADEAQVAIQIIRECDLNNDGVTQFTEFCFILRRYSEQEIQEDTINS